MKGKALLGKGKYTLRHWKLRLSVDETKYLF